MIINRNEVLDTVAKMDSGAMSRRGFIARMGALGVSGAVANFVALSPLGVRKAWAQVSGPEERA